MDEPQKVTEDKPNAKETKPSQTEQSRSDNPNAKNKEPSQAEQSPSIDVIPDGVENQPPEMIMKQLNDLDGFDR